MSRAFPVLLLLVAVFGRADEKPFYLTLDTPPAPELTPDEALAAFAVAPGFRVELVAAEPLVEDPVAIAWDEFADLYVVEMRGFMPDAWGRGAQEPVGTVNRLTDRDGDGVYDAREVLLDGLVLPRAVAVVNEGLLIGEPPNLWLCPTLTGDSRGIDCSDRIRLGDYGMGTGGVEHAENGLLSALDNWIYNAKSDRRFKLRGAELIVGRTLFRGQWGIAQDDAGRLYYNTNSHLLLGDLYDAQPVVEAGNRRAPGLNVPISRDDSLHAVRVNPGVNRAYVPGVLRADGRLDKPTSASGMTVYRGDAFPHDHRGNVYVTEPAANAVVRLRLRTGRLSASAEQVLYPDSTWGQREFLASTDERFRPVDVEVGPDGALHVVDMYRGIIQDQMFLSDELRHQALERGLDRPVGLGRIWRVVPESAGLRTRRMPGGSDDELIEWLGHANGWHRDTAQRLLTGRQGRRADGKLRRLVNAGKGPAALHALWTLDGRGSLDEATLERALASGERDLQLAAMKAGQARLPRKTLLTLARSPEPDVAHHATLYLYRHNGEPEVIRFLADSLALYHEDPIRLVGVQVAASGSELALIDALLTTNPTGPHRDAAVAMIESLVAQALRGDVDQSEELLDAVLDLENPDIRRAMLRGLSNAIREDGFEPVVLAGPHPLFTNAPDDLWPEIAPVRRGFTWEGDDLPDGARPLSPQQARRMQTGQAYFLGRCAICHGADGQGMPSLGPPLAGTDRTGGPAEHLARIVLHGLQGPITVNGETWNGIMPGHGADPGFTDEVAGGLLTWLGRSFGNPGRVVEPAFVREVREMEAGRTALWTAQELAGIDVNTHLRAYAATYRGEQLELLLTYNGQGLDIASVYFNGPLVEVGDDVFLFEPRQLRLEFIWKNGVISGVRLPGMDGVVLPRVVSQ